MLRDEEAMAATAPAALADGPTLRRAAVREEAERKRKEPTESWAEMFEAERLYAVREEETALMMGAFDE